jgi:hypothetical protein
MKYNPILKFFLFLILLLIASSASSQSLSQDNQAQSKDQLNVLWRFDTGG